MPGDGEKGSFKADIPDSVLEDALRSVEKRVGGPGASEPGPGGDDPPPTDPGAAPDDASRVSALEAEVARLAAEAEEARIAAGEQRDRLLRAAADLENARKRAAREKDEIRQQAVAPVVKDLLPAIDNLERALAAAPPDDVMAGGVRMVLKQVEEALARHAVVPRSARGQPFDPNVHEALASVEAPGVAPGTVVTEHGRAWFLHGRLLRPAMVAVAAPDAGGSGGAGEDTSPAGEGA